MQKFNIYRLIDLLIPILAVILALAVGALILLTQETNPFEAYAAMFSGAFTNKNGMADTLVKAIPLLLVALGIAIAFRGGVINIGAGRAANHGRPAHHLDWAHLWRNNARLDCHYSWHFRRCASWRILGRRYLVSSKRV